MLGEGYRYNTYLLEFNTFPGAEVFVLEEFHDGLLRDEDKVLGLALGLRHEEDARRAFYVMDYRQLKEKSHYLMIKTKINDKKFALAYKYQFLRLEVPENDSEVADADEEPVVTAEGNIADTQHVAAVDADETAIPHLP